MNKNYTQLNYEQYDLITVKAHRPTRYSKKKEILLHLTSTLPSIIYFFIHFFLAKASKFTEPKKYNQRMFAKKSSKRALCL